MEESNVLSDPEFYEGKPKDTTQKITEKRCYTYIAKCSDNSFYVGSTDNLKNRKTRHNEGVGSNYTEIRRPVKIIYFEEFKSRSEAIQREFQLKGWTKEKKKNLILYGHPKPNTYAHIS